MAQGFDAMAAGDGAKLLDVIAKKTVPAERERLLQVLGGRADDNRWDVRHGRAVLFAADVLLAEPAAHIDRFLPVMAIAAAREHQYTAKAKHERGAEILARLRPLVAKSAFGADLATRSGCHAWDHDERGISKDLWELVADSPLAKKTEYFKQLAKHHKPRSKTKTKTKPR